MNLTDLDLLSIESLKKLTPLERRIIKEHLAFIEKEASKNTLEIFAGTDLDVSYLPGISC